MIAVMIKIVFKVREYPITKKINFLILSLSYRTKGKFVRKPSGSEASFLFNLIKIERLLRFSFIPKRIEHLTAEKKR